MSYYSRAQSLRQHVSFDLEAARVALDKACQDEQAPEVLQALAARIMELEGTSTRMR